MAKWIERVAGETCPNFVFDIGPELDAKTEVRGENDKVIGCRGITCEECWNQESEE